LEDTSLFVVFECNYSAFCWEGLRRPAVSIKVRVFFLGCGLA